MGKELQALRVYESYVENAKPHDEYSEMVYKIFEDSGIEAALRFISEFELKSEDPDFDLLAILHTLTGEIEKALDQIEYNINNYIPPFAYIQIEPVFKILRSEPRFQAVISDLGYDQ
jgi:hypothetical protein